MTIPMPAPLFTAAAFRRGFVAALPFIVSYGVAGIAMGVAYRGVGLDFIPAVLFSLVVYSGTAQAVTLGLWTLPPPIGAMMAACVAINARYLVMSAHLRQIFPHAPKRLMLPVLFFLGDASWLMTAAEAGRGRRDVGYLLGANLPMAIGWIGGTALAYAMPLKPQGPLAVAAAVLPLAFVAALLPTQWRGQRTLLSWGVAAAVGIAVVGVLGQGWAMLAGGAAGTLVSAVTDTDD